MVRFYRYIMSLVGLNLTAEYSQASLWGLPVPTAVLSPDKLEAAIAQVAAQIIWIGKRTRLSPALSCFHFCLCYAPHLAGKIGSSNGGLPSGNGMTYVDQEIIGLRLNVGLDCTGPFCI